MKTKNYMSFDKARRTGRRISHKHIYGIWFELDELFQEMGEMFTKAAINEMLDTEFWLVEGIEYEN